MGIYTNYNCKIASTGQSIKMKSSPLFKLNSENLRSNQIHLYLITRKYPILSICIRLKLEKVRAVAS